MENSKELIDGLKILVRALSVSTNVVEQEKEFATDTFLDAESDSKEESESSDKAEELTDLLEKIHELQEYIETTFKINIYG